jgi:hypothetical protein
MAIVRFEFETQYGKYADAVYYDDAEPMTPEEIEAEKHHRLDSWIAFVKQTSEV